MGNTLQPSNEIGEQNGWQFWLIWLWSNQSIKPYRSFGETRPSHHSELSEEQDSIVDFFSTAKKLITLKNMQAQSISFQPRRWLLTLRSCVGRVTNWVKVIYGTGGINSNSFYQVKSLSLLMTLSNKLCQPTITTRKQIHTSPTSQNFQ